MLEDVSRIISFFEKTNPIPKCELEYSDRYQLVVAVILSAQTTDAAVNNVTKRLFEKFPNWKALSQAPIDEIESLIHSLGLSNTKANKLSKLSNILTDSKLPSEIDDLMKFPGIGIKSANLIRSLAFGLPGLAVDTHVKRVANRIGLVNEDNNEKITNQLKEIFPIEYWSLVHLWLVTHGRYVCTASHPKCHACGLRVDCITGRKI